MNIILGMVLGFQICIQIIARTTCLCAGAPWLWKTKKSLLAMGKSGKVFWEVEDAETWVDGMATCLHNRLEANGSRFPVWRLELFSGGFKTRISFYLELAKKGAKFGIYIDTVGILVTNREFGVFWVVLRANLKGLVHIAPLWIHIGAQKMLPRKLFYVRNYSHLNMGSQYTYYNGMKHCFC